MIRFYRDFDLDGARRSFERAIELNPAYAEAHHNFAAYYSVTGRHDEAVASVQRARRLDPLSSMVNSDVGFYYYFARRYDEAIEHSLRTLALDPDFYWAKLCIQLAYLQRADWQGAMEHARREAAEAEAPADLLERLSSPDRCDCDHHLLAMATRADGASSQQSDSSPRISLLTSTWRSVSPTARSKTWRPRSRHAPAGSCPS